MVQNTHPKGADKVSDITIRTEIKERRPIVSATLEVLGTMTALGGALSISLGTPPVQITSTIGPGFIESVPQWVVLKAVQWLSPLQDKAGITVVILGVSLIALGKGLAKFSNGAAPEE